MQNFVAVVVLSLIVSATFLSGYSQLVGGPRHGFKGHPYYEQEKLGMRMAGRRVVKPVGPLGYAELQAVLLAMAVVLMVSSCLAFAFGLLHEHEMQEHPGNGDPANMLFAEQACKQTHSKNLCAYTHTISSDTSVFFLMRTVVGILFNSVSKTEDPDITLNGLII